MMEINNNPSYSLTHTHTHCTVVNKKCHTRAKDDISQHSTEAAMTRSGKVVKCHKTLS